MIAAFMTHALTVSALCALAGWAAERALAGFGRPRRLAWIMAMLLSVVIPLTALLPAIEHTPAPLAVAVAAASETSATPIYHSELLTLPSISERPMLETTLRAAWIAVSTAALLIYLVTALRLAQRARSWSRLDFAKGNVLIADDMGPAVLGLFRPEIVFPRWLFAAPASTQQLALAHEQQHVAARDPLLLALALALVVVLPWNLPLLWQLRRLRFALEVDCDARVLASGVDAGDYAETLLAVSQRAARVPLGSVALIERISQLERRINIMIVTPRLSMIAATMTLVFGASCLLAATRLDAPAHTVLSGATTLKPPPTTDFMVKLAQRFEKYLKVEYPELIEREATGMPVVVVLLNPDTSVAASAKTMAINGTARLHFNEDMFGILGVPRESVPYVGVVQLQVSKDPVRAVMMVYTERAATRKKFVSKIYPDNRAVDRQIFREYFPDAARLGVRAGDDIWVLLDRAGHVIRSGQEPVKKSSWNRTLESRFAGIKTESLTLTPITDDSGEPIKDSAGKALQLHSVWLASGSPPPTP